MDRLREAVGPEACSNRTADLYTYGFDASIHHRTPDMVIQPRSTDQVSEVMRIAYQHGIPVVPRGGGTGLCGSAVPVQGGIVMDMSRMDSILEISVGDLCCVVEAGCVYQDLNDALAPHGFWFPPSPGSSDACQIGGMVAANASGMKAVKYGATRDYVLGLTFVKANGDVVKAGTRTLKDSSGYQLARLMVGSEGTLGIITDVTLKIAARPKTSAMVLAAFPDPEAAGRCVSAIIAKPLIPSSLELMDSVSIDAVNKALGNPLPDCKALCMIEVDGEPEIVEKELKIVEEVARSEGAITVEATHDRKAMNRWNNSRKAIMTSLAALRPGYSSVSLADDMVLPISKIPAAVVAYQRIAEKYDVTVATYGHAADGNLHTKMLLDPNDADSWQRGEKAVDEIFEATLALGGSVTGEHGVGISKAPNFHKERSSVIPTMVEIKKAMDPKNILNPGKLDQWEGSILRMLRYPCSEYQD
ncbi:MAG: FAD-binding oxidoreductase [Candidatus Methanomethylophilaceae archaeon]|nr:FAD-binding oxidoreductase [Candidatus Methanomethylophilaceae archaeon]